MEIIIVTRIDGICQVCVEGDIENGNKRRIKKIAQAEDNVKGTDRNW